MPEDVVTPEQLRALARSWWIAVVLGVLSIVAGGIVLARPDHSLRALAVIIGIFILIDGIVELYWAIVHRVQSTATAALLGILNVVVGVLLIRHPIAGVQAVALFIGIWLIAVGVVRAVVAFDAPGGALGRLLIAGVEILAGIVIVAAPDIGYATLTSSALSSQISPPMSSTNRRQMVRPSPVPPCFRVVDGSAWLNG